MQDADKRLPDTHFPENRIFCSNYCVFKNLLRKHLYNEDNHRGDALPYGAFLLLFVEYRK